jgi:peptidyl-prolyl cis-trans isomerase B (cyclophilin B)
MNDRESTRTAWSAGYKVFRLSDESVCARPVGLAAFAALFVLLLHEPSWAQERNPHVIMETSLGKLRFELFADKAPVSVKNFLQYVDERHYDGLVFHRVIPGFMIQGGGLARDLKEKPTRAPIANESANGLSNARGTLAMARTNVPDSATTQFFINLKDNASLDKAKAPDNVGYAVFGKVIDGMDVIDKISRVKTVASGGHRDVPAEPIVIQSIRKAAAFSVAVSGSTAPGKLISIMAQVDFPSAGETLTLMLPAELNRVEGKAVQPVPVTSGSTIVLWKVRADAAGDFTVSVRSSSGAMQSRALKIKHPE